MEPVLGYEAEEAGILKAAAGSGTELVVEESGTLEGLRFTAESYGPGYFDVLHVSGHAAIEQGQPVFLVENELGGPALATAEEIARAMDGQWPRLVFVSGCLTGGAPDRGTVPSMSESLVQAGAPAVLGWALPVGDISATAFAARLYRDLAAGQPLDRAVVDARRELYARHSSSWHLLRVYADKSPLAPMVTPRNTPGRERVRVRQAAEEFLDPQTQVFRVASRAGFVGRRRVIQRCLRTLRQPLGSPGAAGALVLAGMGGLGKSTLASRLLERMPTHQRVVWFGRVDLAKFRELTSKVTFGTLDQQIEAAGMLARDEVDLAVRLRYLFAGPLGQVPCLFVFDDFEEGNLDERDGGHVLSGEMARILPALLRAIRETDSPSRVIITSRYQFPAPAGTAVRVESLETLSANEQVKNARDRRGLRLTVMTSVARWVEVHRLAVAGQEAAIARDVGDRLVMASVADSTGPSVPSLFRQTPINSGKQREPTSNEIAGQTAYLQVRHHCRKFELYFDCSFAGQRPKPSLATMRAMPQPVGGSYGSPGMAGGQGDSGTPGKGADALSGQRHTVVGASR